jgi:beta-galactosidase
MKPVTVAASAKLFPPRALFLLALLSVPLGWPMSPMGCASDPSAKPAPPGGDKHPATQPAATQPAARADGNPADQGQGKAGIIRIKAGTPVSITDADGNTWEGERGFTDGQTEDRSRMTIEGTSSPDLYRTERWGMTHFSVPVPDGKYAVRLHFCETWDGITAPGGRVFDVKVGDKQIKDLDVFKEAGGPHKPLVKTVETTVTDGKLDVQFVEQPEHNHAEINAIEIIPEK